MTQAQLARKSGVGPRTVIRFELGGERKPLPADLCAIRSALETVGIISIDANGEGPGLWLRKN